MAVKITDRSDEIKRQVNQANNHAAKRVAERSLDLARQAAPVKTGNLRDSGHIEQTGEAEWEGTFEADYASAVHDGHHVKNSKGGISHVAANPFAAQAVADADGDSLAVIKEEMSRVK